MKIALLLHICRTDLPVVIPGTLSSAKHCLADDYPGIVVRKNTCILLIACRITGNLTIFHHIFGEGGLIQHYAMLAIKMLLDRIKRLLHETFLKTDTRHCAPSLRLDENLSLLILLRTYLSSEIVVCTQEPFAIPAIFLHSLNHGVYMFLGSICLVFHTQLMAKLYVIISIDHKLSGYHQRLCL